MGNTGTVATPVPKAGSAFDAVVPNAAKSVTSYYVDVRGGRVRLSVELPPAGIEALLDVSGIPTTLLPSDIVRINSSNNGNSYTIEFSRGYGEAGITMERIVFPKEKRITNEYFRDGKQSGISGTELFGLQVKNAQAAGFRKLQVYAGGYKVGTMNGYYTWLRFGYKPYGNEKKTNLVDSLPPEAVAIYNKSPKTFSPNGKLTGLMQTAEGRALWREYGSSWYGDFDLKKGSYSDKTFREYYKNKIGKSLN